MLVILLLDYIIIIERITFKIRSFIIKDISDFSCNIDDANINDDIEYNINKSFSISYYFRKNISIRRHFTKFIV